MLDCTHFGKMGGGEMVVELCFDVNVKDREIFDHSVLKREQKDGRWRRLLDAGIIDQVIGSNGILRGWHASRR